MVSRMCARTEPVSAFNAPAMLPLHGRRGNADAAFADRNRSETMSHYSRQTLRKQVRALAWTTASVRVPSAVFAVDLEGCEAALSSLRIGRLLP